MSRLGMFMWVLFLAWAASAWGADPNPEQAKAVTDINELGGRAVVSADEAVIDVDMEDTRVTDPWLKHFTGSTKLQGLHLSCTKVTDAGLEVRQRVDDAREN